MNPARWAGQAAPSEALVVFLGVMGTTRSEWQDLNALRLLGVARVRLGAGQGGPLIAGRTQEVEEAALTGGQPRPARPTPPTKPRPCQAPPPPSPAQPRPAPPHQAPPLQAPPHQVPPCSHLHPALPRPGAAVCRKAHLWPLSPEAADCGLGFGVCLAGVRRRGTAREGDPGSLEEGTQASEGEAPLWDSRIMPPGAPSLECGGRVFVSSCVTLHACRRRVPPPAGAAGAAAFPAPEFAGVLGAGPWAACPGFFLRFPDSVPDHRERTGPDLGTKERQATL